MNSLDHVPDVGTQKQWRLTNFVRHFAVKHLQEDDIFWGDTSKHWIVFKVRRSPRKRRYLIPLVFKKDEVITLMMTDWNIDLIDLRSLKKIYSTNYYSLTNYAYYKKNHKLSIEIIHHPMFIGKHLRLNQLWLLTKLEVTEIYTVFAYKHTIKHIVHRIGYIHLFKLHGCCI